MVLGDLRLRFLTFQKFLGSGQSPLLFLLTRQRDRRREVLAHTSLLSSCN
jgi:hypothetical protein